MDPRLKSSNTWSALPGDVTKMILKLLKEQFTKRVPNGVFHSEGRIYQNEVLLRIGFLSQGDIKQNNFEGSIEYKPGSEKVVDCIQHLYHATASMMETFFAQPDTNFPEDWLEFDVEEKTVYLRHSSVNTALEAEADKLLGSEETALINKNSEAELEEIKASVGLSKEDDKKTPTVH